MVDRVIREEKLPARLMMSCHDEIGVSSNETDALRKTIVNRYTDFSSDTSPIKMRVPITASGDFGDNWYEASK
jgi:DNA polymerase I-like protein with 3'-5' exonuclease and polymerase domains